MLAGQGPHLHVYDQHGHKVLSTRVFEAQPIHGIQSSADADVQKDTHRIDVVLWGGPSMRSATLAIPDEGDFNGKTELSLSLWGEFTSPDWILRVVLHHSSIFLLTAHNVLLEVPASRDTRTNPEAVIRGPGSFLYSADLCVTSPNLIIVASGTVFGEILVWTCSKGGKAQEWPASIRHVFRGHSGSVFGVAISDQFELEGRNVRLLASCSDDRTIKLWDISDCNEPGQSPSSPITLTETGFGEAAQAGERQLASAWGHQSRIWGVEFVPVRATGGQPIVQLSSQGEDAAYHLWSYEPSSGSFMPAESPGLKPIYHDRHHSGKNIWSMSQLRDGQYLMVCTGGADGQIIQRRLEIDGLCLTPSFTVPKAFKEITGSSRHLRHYLVLNENECLATTDLGELYRLKLHNGRLETAKIYQSPTKGSLALCHAEAQGFTILSQQTGGLSALLVSGKEPLPIPLSIKSGISWMQVAPHAAASASHPTICLVAVLTDRQAIVLWLTLNNLAVRVRETTLTLPSTFSITACCYDSVEQVLILGSRAGALAIYRPMTPEVETSGAPFCLRHLHSTDTVSSVTFLSTSSENLRHLEGQTYILTTGRDGTYAVHSLTWPQSSDSRAPLFRTVHLSSPPFGPIIGGAYITSSGSSLSAASSDLVLYGFRSTSFVVWNETQQFTMLSIECGGAHRFWSYKDSSVFMNKAVEPGRPNSRAKTFIWTQANKVNWHSAHGPSHTVIQKGGHGREIKTVARCPSRFHRGHLIATGAEDTTIQLLTLADYDKPHDELKDLGSEGHGPNATFHRIATLKRHTTGLQHLQFSSSGAFLFSSAGCEEFYAWKLTPDVPYIGVGVVLWDIMPTTEEDSDARIMSFDLLENPSGVPQTSSPIGNNSGEGVANENSEESYTLVLAYSNGKTKVVRYTPSSARDQGKFHTLREVVYGSFCVMQAFFLPTPATSVLTDNYNPTRLAILSAGTNGILNLSSVTVALQPERPNAESTVSSALQVHRTHQSSILGMDVVRLDANRHFVATGGDDNGLGLTLVTSAPSSISKATSAPYSKDGVIDNSIPPNFRTIFIPRAHAAAVTAVKITKMKRTASKLSLAVITAGNDQRVRVWIVHIYICTDTDVTVEDTAHINSRQDESSAFWEMQVERAASSWTAVADVSGLELVDANFSERDQSALGDRSERATSSGNRKSRSTETGPCTGNGFGCKILVVGVGMELLNVH